MARKTSRIKASREPALTITRIGFQADKVIYIAKANKSIRYPNGERSSIAYIGVTKKGASRIAASAAYRAGDILCTHGITQLEFFVVTAQPKRRVNIPLKLERALLIRFRERYESVPVGNSHGKRLRWRDEREFFAYDKLDKILDQYE